MKFFLTRLMSVNRIVPNSVLPILSSEDEKTFVEEGKNQPSMRAKSRRPSFWNNNDAPSRILLMMLIGKRGGVWYATWIICVVFQN